MDINDLVPLSERARYKDITGRKKGRLTFISVAGKSRNSTVYWNCVCDCGNECLCSSNSYKVTEDLSCGCWLSEKSRKQMTKHGGSQTSTYRSYIAMLNRCYDSASPSYKRYGGVGVIVCDRWLESYENFYADMGERPEGMTLDRIDSKGNYSVANCKWSTVVEQNQNRKNAITNVQTVVNMRLDYAMGLTVKQVMEKYCPSGSISQVRKIIKGESWANVGHIPVFRGYERV